MGRRNMVMLYALIYCCQVQNWFTTSHVLWLQF